MLDTWYQVGQVEVVRMTTQDAAREQEPVAKPVTEFEARSAPGIPVLVISIAMILAAALLLYFVAQMSPSSGQVALVWAAILLFVVAGFALRGLTPVIAGE